MPLFLTEYLKRFLGKDESACSWGCEPLAFLQTPGKVCRSTCKTNPPTPQTVVLTNTPAHPLSEGALARSFLRLRPRLEPPA